MLVNEDIIYGTIFAKINIKRILGNYKRVSIQSNSHNLA